jgi:hypothetical protein
MSIDKPASCRHTVGCFAYGPGLRISAFGGKTTSPGGLAGLKLDSKNRRACEQASPINHVLLIVEFCFDATARLPSRRDDPWSLAGALTPYAVRAGIASPAPAPSCLADAMSRKAPSSVSGPRTRSRGAGWSDGVFDREGQLFFVWYTNQEAGCYPALQQAKEVPVPSVPLPSLNSKNRILSTPGKSAPRGRGRLDDREVRERGGGPSPRGRGTSVVFCNEEREKPCRVYPERTRTSISPL